MPVMRAQVTIQKESGIPADAVVNTFHFNASADDATSRGEIYAAISDFYTTPLEGNTLDIASYLSPELADNSAVLDIYNLSHAEPREPVLTQSIVAAFGTAGAGPSALPDELAICMSFRGDYASGQPDARRRGRVYLGPLNAYCAAADALGQSRPYDAVLTTIAQTGARILDANNADLAWVVWSRAAQVGFPVTSVWCDNAWDIQRRRGVLPTQRFSAN